MKVEEYYKEITAGIEALSAHTQGQGAGYCGTKKRYLGIKTPVKRTFIKKWYQEHKNEISLEEWISLITKLSESNTHESVCATGTLLAIADDFRQKINPFLLDTWLNNAEGWAEVDSFCQGKFSAKEILSNWKEWKAALLKMAGSKNPHKRRACLVLLTRPVREVKDKQLSNLAFLLIEKNKENKNILVTKAISWLLREMIKNYREAVEIYLNQNIDSLPKIAVRETKNKLLTGKK